MYEKTMSSTRNRGDLPKESRLRHSEGVTLANVLQTITKVGAQADLIAERVGKARNSLTFHQHLAGLSIAHRRASETPLCEVT